MILRCTTKMLKLLGVRTTGLPELSPSDDDWYLNLLWIERRKCLLLTHAGTLFPVFVADVRKAEITPIEPYVVSLVREHLGSEDLPHDTLGALDPDDVQLARTASRSVLGVMNDTAIHARYRIEAMGGIDRSDSYILNRFLRRALHSRAGVYATPLDLIAGRLGSDTKTRSKTARLPALGPVAGIERRLRGTRARCEFDNAGWN